MSKSFTSAVALFAALCTSAVFAQVQAPDQAASRKVEGPQVAQDGGSGPQAVPSNRPENNVRQGNLRQENRAARNNNAAQPNQPGERAHAHAGYTQHDLAELMQICNDNEVKISQLGADKADHADVKKFAQEMVKVHTDMIAKIQQADAAGIAAADGANRQSGNNAAGNVGRRSASVDPSHDSPIVSLNRELAAQCLASHQAELGKKSGADFDKCFMGAQLGMHMGAIDSMKVFQRHTSGELRQTIDEGIKTAEGHLEHAKSIMKTLETAAK